MSRSVYVAWALWTGSVIRNDIMGNGQININDIIRIGKKLLFFYRKWSRKHQQNQHAQQQQQQPQHYQQQPNNQYQTGSPYPPVVGQANQHSNNAWNQPHQQQQSHGGYGGGGYGAHDGKPTLTTFPFHAPSLHPLLRHTTTYSLSPFANAYRIPNPCLPLALSLLGTRAFSTSLSLSRRGTSNLYDPTSSFPPPTHRRPLLPSLPTDPPPPPRRPPVKLSIFHLLPAFLRPSYKTLLRIDDDLLVHLDDDDQNYDMANAQNASYVDLRNKAIHEGDLMAKCFADSQRAYTAGDGSAAHDLSLQGKEHQRLKEQYNDQAAQWIFNENNKVQPVGSVDLHGLYVQESIEYTERAIENARNQGLSELRVIVGKGNHSPSHVAKLKPAITSLMSRQHLSAHLDPHNNGVLIVQLQQQGGGMRGGDEVVRSVGQKEDGGCMIM
ncbi:Smr domain-containing protein [Sporobolomyces koalae]|uniref:Smr domain-containing protein n=1 Tax=Sporobolomyces koalae TaxID=500713 RepID=UPI00317DDD5D